jgi:N-hydroxyarylamine O-acetyltransferase
VDAAARDDDGVSDDRLDARRTDAYLARLGLTRDDVRPDLAGLTLLHERHLRTVPFENLSVHLREPIVLDAGALVDKLTVRGRGGFCYELNGAFAALLTTLGFAVDRYEARVGPDGGGMPFDHLCLRVEGDGVDHLADVGFGGSFLHPRRMKFDVAQDDPAGTYELRSVANGWFDLVEDGEVQFRCATTPRALVDFAGGCTHHSTSPESPFTQGTICSRATPEGRVTIAGRTLKVTTDGGTTEREVADDAELLALYREHFGIDLDAVPAPLHPR